MLTARDILPGKFDEYKRRIELLWRQLVEYHSCLFVLQEVEKFPFQLLYGEMAVQKHFWKLTRNNCFERLISISWRIAVDGNPSSLTLIRLRDWLPHFVVKSSLRALQNHLEDGFDKTFERYRSKIDLIRKKYVAHFDKKMNISYEIPRDLLVTLEELKEIGSLLEQLLRTLSLDNYYDVWLWEYQPSVRDKLADVIALLDYEARSSPLMSAIRGNDPTWTWSEIRQGLTDGDIAIINHYCRKFGWDEVT